MTIRVRKPIGRKKASLLLTVLIYETVNNGIDLITYMCLLYLHNWLTEDKTNLAGNEVKVKKALVLSKYLLRILASEWMNFEDKVKIELPPEIIEEYSVVLPDLRQYRSWIQTFTPRQFLELRIVPLEQFLERESNTSRYTSYTKGYGNGGKAYPASKTRPSPELDGDDNEEKQYSLSEEEYVQIDRINQLLDEIDEQERYEEE